MFPAHSFTNNTALKPASCTPTEHLSQHVADGARGSECISVVFCSSRLGNRFEMTCFFAAWILPFYYSDLFEELLRKHQGD